MKVAAIQHDIVWEDAAATCRHLDPMIAGAAASGARLIVLTEMFSTGFTMAPDRVAEPMEGPSSAWLHEQATRYGAWMCASIPTIDPTKSRPVNRLFLFAPDGSAHHYDKIHPFSYGGEDEHYEAGTQFLTVDIEGLKASFFVCYDLRFADEFWQLAPVTDCYVVPASWPEARRLPWQSLLQSRAIENQAYVIGVNRVGSDPTANYAGDSRIVDPLGELLATGAKTEAVLIAEVDPAVVAAARARYRFGQDRRTASYFAD
jgi:predicted amidohydrolase